ncbi:transmembrane protein 256 homolog isoform X4 [Amborella trichopoda]|uniref:transmembrane protein 256 homolog isoform X4 n=1 Tax=Amborella trichopoda TaxID=13333 RepID=UPI0009BCFDED|nr:transmembrane protein 256 homolog isoform X4 [Amborella trichopoda]|eukprot:XP_020525832.1 transmembrane protein 256 homolog isoform X4 [Amborella trichopoda]
MDPLLWHRVAAVSGVAALGLGTYGAHVFQPHNPAYKDVWQTASLYHLVHTAALLAAPITKHPHVFGSLLTTGILAFSGTMMVVVIMMIIILLLIMDGVIPWHCLKTGSIPPWHPLVDLHS